MILTFHVTGMTSLSDTIVLLERVREFLCTNDAGVVALIIILDHFKTAIQKINEGAEEWLEIRNIWQIAQRNVIMQIKLVLDQLKHARGFTEYSEIICKGVFATIPKIIFEFILKAPFRTAITLVQKTILDIFFTLLHMICISLNAVRDIIATIQCLIDSVRMILERIISILSTVRDYYEHDVTLIQAIIGVLGELIAVFTISPEAQRQYNQISPPVDLSPVSRTAGLAVGAVVGQSVCPIPVLGAVVGGFVGRWAFHLGHRVCQNILN